MKSKFRKQFALVASLAAWLLVASPAANAAHQCQPQQVQTGTQQVQTGTRQVQVGTNTVPVYETQPVYGTVAVYETQPVYSTVAVYETQPVYGTVPVYETQPVYSTRYVPAEYGTRTVERGTKIVDYVTVSKTGWTDVVTCCTYWHTNYWKNGTTNTCYASYPIDACGTHGNGYLYHKMGSFSETQIITYTYNVREPVYGPAYVTERYQIAAGYTQRYESGTKQVKVGTEQVQIGTKQVKVGTEQVQTGTKQVYVGTEQVQTGTKQVKVGTTSAPVYETQSVYATVPVYEIVCVPIPHGPQPVTTYTLSYSPNGGSGSAPASATANVGTTISLAGSGSLTRAGYSFTGWSLTPSGSTIGSVSLNGNVTVYAIWSAVPVVTYTVTYNANGGTNPPASISVPSGGQFTAAAGTAMTAPTGKRFAGWNTSSTATGPTYAPGGIYSPTGNVTLYAVWLKSVVRPT